MVTVEHAPPKNDGSLKGLTDMMTAAIESRNAAPQPSSRKERAIAIRAAVLAWLRKHGVDEVIEGCRVRSAEIGEFQFLYRTPFSGTPAPKKNATRGFAGALLSQQRRFGRPYSLDVWTARKKVLNIEWGN